MLLQSGSHRDTTIADQVQDPKAPGGLSKVMPELLEARCTLVPPTQPAVQQGDLVLRDVRLEHAGMPNKTERSRYMLVFGLFPWWY